VGALILFSSPPRPPTARLLLHAAASGDENLRVRASRDRMLRRGLLAWSYNIGSKVLLTRGYPARKGIDPPPPLQPTMRAPPAASRHPRQHLWYAHSTRILFILLHPFPSRRCWHLTSLSSLAPSARLQLQGGDGDCG
jgi:hypothetical protein